MKTLPKNLQNKYKTLGKLAAIRHRNAGQTLKLLNKKSINARNETIHEAVQFVSFDDVPSK